MNNELRLKGHQKKIELEFILKELEGLLSPLEEKIIQNFDKPKRPIFLIVGCARSGTTLLYQYLSKTGFFCYPTNLMSRFYYAPYIGAKIKRMLVDLDSKEEVFGAGGDSNKHFESNLGKVKGADSPHEFWYFWRRFFQFDELQQLTDDELRRIDTGTFLKELTALQDVFQKPLLMKGMIMNWHIPFLASLSENIHFIFIKRQILYNAQSLLKAREKFYGNQDEWYSFKPEEYHEIKDKSKEEQVVKQVYFTNKAIQIGLEGIDESRYMTIDYDDFCKAPEKLISFIKKRIKTDIKNMNSSEIVSKNDRVVKLEQWNLMLKALEEID